MNSEPLSLVIVLKSSLLYAPLRRISSKVWITLFMLLSRIFRTISQRVYHSVRTGRRSIDGCVGAVLTPDD